MIISVYVQRDISLAITFFIGPCAVVIFNGSCCIWSTADFQTVYLVVSSYFKINIFRSFLCDIPWKSLVFPIKNTKYRYIFVCNVLPHTVYYRNNSNIKCRPQVVVSNVESLHSDLAARGSGGNIPDLQLTVPLGGVAARVPGAVCVGHHGQVRNRSAQRLFKPDDS